MNSNISNCSCCSNDDKSESSLEQIMLCPKCDNNSIEVNEITVRNFVIDDNASIVTNGKYYICIDSSCDVVYFHEESNIIFNKEDLKEPVWFKKGANPRYICYCSKVTEQDIINAVTIRNAKNINDIIRLTGAMKNSNCIINNPIGKCCSSNIKEVINNTLEK